MVVYRPITKLALSVCHAISAHVILPLQIWVTHVMGASKSAMMEIEAPPTLDERMSRGQQEHAAQQFHDAKDTFQSIVKDYPYYSKAWMSLGSSEYRLRAFLLAEKSWKEGLRLNPMDVNGYSNLGSLLLEQQRFDEAIYYWKLGLQIDGNNKGIWLNLANLYKKLGFTARSHNLFQKYQKIAGPRDGESQKIQRRTHQGFSAYKPNIQIAQLALKQNQLDHARRALDKALEYYVGTAKDYRIYGALFFKLGRLPEAKKAYLQSIELDETDVKSHINLGVVEEKNARWVDALWAYVKASRLLPEGSEVLGKLNRRVDSILREIKSSGDGAFKAYLEAAIKSREQYRFDDAKSRLVRLQELLPHTDDIKDQIEAEMQTYSDMFDPKHMGRQQFYTQGEEYLKQGIDEGALYLFNLYREYFPDDNLSSELVEICEALEAQIELKEIEAAEDRRMGRGRVAAKRD